MSMSEGDPLGPSQPPASTPPATGYGTGPVPPGAFQPKETFDLGRHRLAGWGPRVGAALIDGLIVMAIFAVIFVPLLAATSILSDSTGGIIGIVLAGLFGAFVFFVASILYAPVLMARWDGQTIGKRAVGIRVIKTSGEPMDLASAFLREALVKGLLAWVVAAFTFAVAPLIDYLWPLWDSENRAIHDFICATRVVEA
ncbi:MAG TPA: RDD family protein [Baekduia sp.]|nr:RDD family protein [Baekduia sp.]